MRALGIVGRSGSGKTTLAAALIPLLRARGLRVSSIKHAHHQLQLDQPGKDSHRHAEAGAEQVLLAGPRGYALFGRHAAPEPAELLRLLAPVDLVLVEGFKSYDMPKLEVHRPAAGQPPLWPAMAVLAVASDVALPACPAPVLNLNDPAAIADFLLGNLGLHTPASVME